VLQVKPHAVPSQVATPFVGEVQGVHEVVPQLMTDVSSAHAAPHTWNPLTQENPQFVPSQVGIEFAGPLGHGEQRVPQCWFDMFVTHPLLHA
jgi:hypothetical protein